MIFLVRSCAETTEHGLKILKLLGFISNNIPRITLLLSFTPPDYNQLVQQCVCREWKSIISLTFLSGRRFFYNDKDWNGKRYPFADVNYFWHLMLKTFCYIFRLGKFNQNQFTNLELTDHWLNLPYPNSKTFSTSNVKNNPHLQIENFCSQSVLWKFESPIFPL